MLELQIIAGKEEHKYYPYTGIFYANRHSFWSAGQDSWTQPPTQNQDLFIQLTNVEPVLQGILQRRRGYTLFSNAFSNLFQHSYSFRSENLGLRRVVHSALNNVVATDEAGNTILNPIFTPSAGAATTPRMVLSRDYGYFADGVAIDSKKWDGSTASLNLTNWGISGASVAAATVGPNAPGTASTVANGGASQAWSNPNNIKVADGLFASLAMTSFATSQFLEGTNFGFAVNGTINGIQVDVKYTGTNNNINGITVGLLKNGNPTGLSKSLLPIPASNMQVSFGGPNDLWGANWLAADINSSNFGMQINWSTGAINATSTVNVDYVQITIFTQPGALTFTTNTTTTNVVLLNGRTYFFTFQNSKTGHNGPLSAASNTTGPLTGNQVNLTNIGISTDPQVDTVNILATADGNDQTTLYLLGSVPNGTTTFNDIISDSLLVTKQLYLNTDQSGVIHGVANNNPPPLINFPIKHKGRFYGSIGRALYFSKNLDEVTTAGGLITSKWEEAWPATNQFDISELAETIQGLLSDGETLWIGTERSIRRLIGDSPNNFQKPEVQFNEVGVLNQDCWKVCFFEGQPVGTMWITPDFRVMESDFNTYVDVGTPIQDLLNTINTSAVGAIHASYVNKGPADYYMLYVPTGSNTSPDTVCVYNLRSKKWFIWRPADNISTSLFLVDSLGLPRWLFASQNGALYEWTSNTFQDRIGNTPLSYAVTIQTSWLDFGDYSIRKFVNQIIPTTADQSSLTIAVDAASNELDFNSPLSVVGTTTVIPAAIPTDVFVPLASGPSHNRAFRFTIISPASTIQNVLTGFSVEAGSFHRY